jgi:hypothetical protein
MLWRLERVPKNLPGFFDSDRLYSLTLRASLSVRLFHLIDKEVL